MLNNLVETDDLSDRGQLCHKLFNQVTLVSTLGYFLLMTKDLLLSNDAEIMLSAVQSAEVDTLPPKDAKCQHLR